MKTLMIDKMNKKQELRDKVIEVIQKGLDPELAELKANEIMRIFGYSYAFLSADDPCPYCHILSDENGKCECIES